MASLTQPQASVHQFMGNINIYGFLPAEGCQGNALDSSSLPSPPLLLIMSLDHIQALLRSLGPSPVSPGKDFIGASLLHDLRFPYTFDVSIVSPPPMPRFSP